ncbi:hypothetical protein DYB32_009044, partial [Aphanomyces invadans]
QSLSKKHILDEDEYVDALDKIIERDFFPDLERLKHQAMAKHTSEDNAAFEELQEKAINDHKRKYHWAYDDPANRGDAKLHLLNDGTWISRERRQLMDKACDTKLRSSVLQLENGDTTSTTMPLLKGGSDEGSVIVVAKRTKRTGAAPKQPMETVYANSRFRSAFLSAQDAASDVNPLNEEVKDFVPMTPLLVPGGPDAASPMITWGSIDATPMILRDDVAATGADWIANSPRIDSGMCMDRYQAWAADVCH